ncbi:unnamed protein product [Leptidea sinapis]|uniref:Uncharacterized protein n=1 Tax=Leptidea sinapis TaxID=189913 RepID=A0A5E4QQ60_9NEOP|nr:unnamed protein product [Leptidea sinapis]
MKTCSENNSTKTSQHFQCSHKTNKTIKGKVFGSKRLIEIQPQRTSPFVHKCPPAADGMERFACPTPDRQGRYRCIDDHVLCDGFIDCPSDRLSVHPNTLANDLLIRPRAMKRLKRKDTKAHLDVLADALLRWARGR